MDLNELLVFARVVQTGSFTAAGAALRMPKSTVSRKVAELEARGAVIVHREETQVESAAGRPARSLARLVAQWQT